MRSVSVSVRIPYPLHREIKACCNDSGYDHLHACIIGALIMFVHNDRRSRWIPMIANAKPKAQDYLLEKLFSFPVASIDEMIKYLKRLDTDPK